MDVLNTAIEIILVLGSVYVMYLGIKKSNEKELKEHFSRQEAGAKKRAKENRLIFENMNNLTEASILTLDYFKGKTLNGEVETLREKLIQDKDAQKEYLFDLIKEESEEKRNG